MKIHELRQLIREEVKKELIQEGLKEKVINGLEIMLMYAGGILFGGPVLLADLPKIIKTKRRENRIDKTSTKEEIQKAAKELYDELPTLKPIERTTLNNHINTMFKNLDKSGRVFGAEHAVKYMNKLRDRYGLSVKPNPDAFKY